MKYAIPLVLLAAVTGLGTSACSEGTVDELPPAGDPVDAEAVEVSVVPEVLPVQGTTRARQRAEISTRMMAQVNRLHVDIGAEVRAGQVLVQLGTADIGSSRAKAVAARDAAQAAHSEADRQARRMETLYEQDVVPMVRRDQARLGLIQAASQLAVAQATLAEVNTAAEYARITAPFDGVVVARHVDAGDLAAPGQPLIDIESVGPRDGVLAVPVERAAGLTPGTEITVRAATGATTVAQVRAVAGGADQRTRTVEALVELPEDWPTGMSITAEIPIGTRQAVLIPVDAVVHRGQLTGVRVVDENGTVLRWVRLGRTDGDRVEVLSGLDADDRIAR